MVGLTNEMSHLVHDKGHNPCQCRSIESGKDGPFPTAGLLLDGGKGGYAANDGTYTINAKTVLNVFGS